MKKADIIKKIQEIDAKLFLDMKEIKQIYGEDSPISNSSRSKWCGISELMKQLNIESDYDLPEWEIAIKIDSEIGMVEQFEEEDFARRDIGF